MKVCLVSTVGGHLAQLEVLAEAVRGHDAFLVTVPSPHAVHVLSPLRRYEVQQVLRNPIAFVRNAVRSLHIYLGERPDFVITTGAGDAAPMVLIAAALGSTVIFLESFARVERPSLFGRLFHRWCDIVLFQWPALQRTYRKGIHVVPVFRPASRRREVPAAPTILVLTGTHTLGFERLLRAVDELAASRRLPGRVIAQIGHSRYEPRNVEHFRFKPHDELLRTLDAADVVVTHDGSASIGEALSRGLPTIVVPRDVSKGEVSYRSDQQLARHLEKMGLVVLEEDPRDLPRALDRLKSLAPARLDAAAKPVGDVIHAVVDSRGPKALRANGSGAGRADVSGLRVAIITPRGPWDPRPGGVRTYTQALATGLADAGARVTLVAPGTGEPEEGSRIDTLPLPGGTGSSARFLAALVLHGPRLRRLAEIVHVQRLDHLLPIAPWVRSARRVVTLHGDAAQSMRLRKGPFVSAVFRILEWAGSLLADAVLAVADGTRTAYESRLPRLRGKIRVVEVGAQTSGNVPLVEDFSISGDGIHGGRVVLFAGRFEPEKNPGLLIDAFAIASRSIRDASLVLVGEGQLEGEVRAKVASVDNDRIHVVPPLPRRQLYSLIRSVTVLAVPSHFEGLPTVALESICLGTPVVTTPVGRMPRILERWSVGRLAAPNPEAFGAALIEVLEHGKQYYAEACASAARELSFDATVDATLRVYQSLFPRGLPN